MQLHPAWTDLVVRLVLTFVAAGLIGLDREARRHAAGLRTTILVGVAAAISMIQANLLLPVDGKTSSSFAELDLMRLPLGILTGVGFIGAGAILRRGNIISGVTTAATLWLATVIGLCFGGGQLALGGSGTALALLTLFGLRRLEHSWLKINRATVVIRTENSVAIYALPLVLEPKGYQARLREQHEDSCGRRRLSYDLMWRGGDRSNLPADVLGFLNAQFDVVSFEFIPDLAY